MELWFIFAVASAVTGGLWSFINKIIAERGYDSFWLITWSSLFAALSSLILLLINGQTYVFWHESTLAALTIGSVFFASVVIRIEALKNIDAAIFFPIYKTLGPALAIIIGVTFFRESFSGFEWLGLILSLLVPILLISKSEKFRQKNLLNGLLLTLAVVFIAAATVSVSKYGSDTTLDQWFYLFLIEVFMFLTGACLLFSKRRTLLWTKPDREFMKTAFWMGLTKYASTACVILAFASGGTLGIVYTINSLYILIPIVFSIIYYHEHWNVRKVMAIVLSVLALWFLQ